jgi:hypothetical protein
MPIPCPVSQNLETFEKECDRQLKSLILKEPNAHYYCVNWDNVDLTYKERQRLKNNYIKAGWRRVVFSRFLVFHRN